jgi:hypothetical protein
MLHKCFKIKNICVNSGKCHNFAPIFFNFLVKILYPQKFNFEIP